MHPPTPEGRFANRFAKMSIFDPSTAVRSKIFRFSEIPHESLFRHRFERSSSRARKHHACGQVPGSHATRKINLGKNPYFYCIRWQVDFSRWDAGRVRSHRMNKRERLEERARRGAGQMKSKVQKKMAKRCNYCDRIKPVRHSACLSTCQSRSGDQTNGS